MNQLQVLNLERATIRKSYRDEENKIKKKSQHGIMNENVNNQVN